MCKKFAKQHEDKLYVLFRVLVGLLFFQHGLQKVFGLLGGTAQTAWTLMWGVGVFELLVGLFIALGLWTRLSSLVGMIIMAAAYYQAHWGFPPIVTKGELAALYFAAFLGLFVYGNGKASLEQAIWKKER
ncbi:MAG: DoxX family protein [Candidatus Nanoarchaeia archaeon]